MPTPVTCIVVSERIPPETVGGTILGTGCSPRAAIAWAKHWLKQDGVSPDGMELIAYKCDRRLYLKVQKDGGKGITWYVDYDMVATLGEMPPYPTEEP